MGTTRRRAPAPMTAARSRSEAKSRCGVASARRRSTRRTSARRAPSAGRGARAGHLELTADAQRRRVAHVDDDRGVGHGLQRGERVLAAEEDDVVAAAGEALADHAASRRAAAAGEQASALPIRLRRPPRGGRRPRCSARNEPRTSGASSERPRPARERQQRHLVALAEAAHDVEVAQVPALQRPGDLRRDVEDPHVVLLPWWSSWSR